MMVMEIVATQWSPLAPAVGAIVAALAGGLLGGILTRKHEGRRWTRDQRMKAYADLIENFTAVYRTLTTLDSRGRREQPDWTLWNRSLAIVYLVAESDMAHQARRIDTALYRMYVKAGPRKIPGRDWVDLREPLEREMLMFVNAARAELGNLGEPLPQLWGRPPDHPEY